MQSTSKHKVNKASAGFRKLVVREEDGQGPLKDFVLHLLGRMSSSPPEARLQPLISLPLHWYSPMTVTMMFKKNSFLVLISKYSPFYVQATALSTTYCIRNDLLTQILAARYLGVGKRRRDDWATATVKRCVRAKCQSRAPFQNSLFCL